MQRRFKKRLKGLSELSYDDRLKLLTVRNLERLEMHRLPFDLLCFYKIIFGLVRIDHEAFFALRTSCTRGHPYKLFKHHSRISVRSNFFAKRVINAWNGLPSDHMFDFSSFPKFQRSQCQHCVLTAIVNTPLLHACNLVYLCLKVNTVGLSAVQFLPGCTCHLY